MNGRKRGWLRLPSPAMIVALIALVFAMSGTGLAATQLVNGDKLIKKATLSGNRLRSQTVTGKQVKAATLGKVPAAAQADAAATASSIINGAIGPAKFGTLPAARVRNSSSQPIPNNILTALSFDTEDFDTAGLHSVTADPSRLTAPVAGKYLIVASVRWEWNTTGRRLLILNLHSATGFPAQIARNDVGPNPTGGWGPEQSVMTVYQLAAGDYVEVLAFEDSGVGLDIQTWAPASPAFSMDWIGP